MPERPIMATPAPTAIAPADYGSHHYNYHYPHGRLAQHNFTTTPPQTSRPGDFVVRGPPRPSPRMMHPPPKPAPASAQHPPQHPPQHQHSPQHQHPSQHQHPPHHQHPPNTNNTNTSTHPSTNNTNNTNSASPRTRVSSSSRPRPRPPRQRPPACPTPPGLECTAAPADCPPAATPPTGRRPAPPWPPARASSPAGGPPAGARRPRSSPSTRPIRAPTMAITRGAAPPPFGWQRPAPIKQYRPRAKPGELFSAPARRVLELILDELKELHLAGGTSSCATCWMRDACSAALAARKLLKYARAALYGDIQLVGRRIRPPEEALQAAGAAAHHAAPPHPAVQPADRRHRALHQGPGHSAAGRRHGRVPRPRRRAGHGLPKPRARRRLLSRL